VRKILIIISILYSGITVAQPVSEAPFKYFGFQAGVVISNMNFNLGSTAPDTTIKSVWKPGFTFGFILQIPLVEKLSLQPEYSFTRRYGNDQSLGTDFRLDYFSMPLLLKYGISDRIDLIAGPQFDLLLNAQSTNKGESTDITHIVEERCIGIVGGLEVHIASAFFISGRYFQSFNNIGIWQRSADVKEFKYQLVSLTAGIRF
jgi:Outer membrane protein beta-barrel domain